MSSPRRLPPRPAFAAAAAVAVAAFLPAGSTRAGPPEHPLVAAFLDDAAVRAAVVSDGRRLVESGAAAPQAELLGQLDRRTCDRRVPCLSGPPPAAGELPDRIAAATLIFARVYRDDDSGRFEAQCPTGFVVSPDGLAVTNHHVLAPPPAAEDDGGGGGGPAGFVAVTRDGRALPVVAALACDPTADVALVRLGLPAGVRLAALPLANAAAVGEDVHCVSHPAGRFFSYARGVVTRRHLLRRGEERTPRLTVSAAFGRGSSGAPIVNGRGEVVGLTASTGSVYAAVPGGRERHLQMVLFDCVPVESLRALFAPPPVSPPTVAAEREPAESELHEARR